MVRPFRISLWVIVLLIVVASTATPSTAAAQVYAHWDCHGSSQCAAVMGGSSGRTGPFSSKAECQAWGRQKIPGGYSCDEDSSSESRPDTPLASSVIGTATLTMLGAGIGSLKKNADGKGEWAAGGVFGGGTAMVIDAVVHRGSRSPATNMIEGALGGAAIGAGVGMLQDGKLVSGSAADKATGSKVGGAAAIGGVAGVTVAFLAPRLEARLFPRFGRLLGPTRSVALMIGARSVGMVVSW